VDRGPAAARLADRQLARLRQVARLALQDAARAGRQLLPVAQNAPVRRLTRLHAQLRLASLQDIEREGADSGLFSDRVPAESIE
jgi:hypothetical protein